MKCVIPEISWHNRDPVLSVDIQPLVNNFYRLASGGGDCHVLIWLLKIQENGATDIEAVADLTRHQRAVNVVRWSQSGQYLASGDDDANIIIWQRKTDNIPLLDGNTNDKEIWVVHKVLRGHKEDVYDVCWSPDDSKLFSGSIDNTAIIWDFCKGKVEKILTDHKGFVQGVSWDPKNEYISTASSDRICRVFTQTGKHLKSRMGRGVLPVPEDHALFGKQVKYFHDDTFKSYFRRLQFSPDGNLLIVPAGCVETDDCKKALNAAFVFTLDDLRDPVAVIPSGNHCSVCVRFCPLLFELRPDGPDPLVSLPYRMIFAIATDTDVSIYDTQQTKPIAYLQRIHYTRLTDISWSNDGLLLVASSTDGFCTMVSFDENELGVVYKEPQKIEEPVKKEVIVESKQNETLVESKAVDVKKHPSILHWAIKTPKRKLEEDVAAKDKATGAVTPNSDINKLTPKRIKPVPVKEDTKSPTVKKKAAENTITPKKKGSILSFIKTVEKQKSTVIADEEARDAWKCQNEDNIQNNTTKSNEVVDLTTDSLEDFKLEISVSQSKDVNSTNTEEDDASDTTEQKNDGSECVINDCKIENKENDSNIPITKTSTEVTVPLQEAHQPPVKKPRRIELITLSSPRSSKKKRATN